MFQIGSSFFKEKKEHKAFLPGGFNNLSTAPNTEVENALASSAV